jgi:hypothetical protein
MDAPNILSTAFQDGYKETETGTICFPDRDPDVFKIITRYLSGYEVFPLEKKPQDETEKLMKNIQADALYYGLSALVEQVEQMDSKSWSVVADVERIDEPCATTSVSGGETMLLRLRNIEAR